MPTVSLLQISGLCKNFGGVQAVDEIGFNLAAGELLGVIGPNGSGKTTLVNLITGFVKPNRGRIVYNDEDITGKPPYKIVRRGIARTFQMVKPFYQLPAYKNMIVPLYSPRVKASAGGRFGDRDAVALDLLEEVGFERDAQVAYKAASVLPQGYLKRLELAKAIALEPDLLLLDELFSGLSLAEVAGMVPIIEKLRSEGRTIIMVTPEDEVAAHAKRVIRLKDGQIQHDDLVNDRQVFSAGE